jgi:hypothetical protein
MAWDTADTLDTPVTATSIAAMEDEGTLESALLMLSQKPTPRRRRSLLTTMQPLLTTTDMVCGFASYFATPVTGYANYAPAPVTTITATVAAPVATFATTNAHAQFAYTNACRIPALCCLPRIPLSLRNSLYWQAFR